MNLITTSTIEKLNRKIEELEKQLQTLVKKININEKIQQGQILALHNGEKLNHCSITGMFKYSDITPRQAFQILNNPSSNYILLDVSDKNFSTTKRPKEALHIPLNELASRIREIDSRTTTIMIISEEGVKSIEACEYLFSENYLCIKHISGGYKFLIEDPL